MAKLLPGPDPIHKVTNALLEKETLNSSEIDKLIPGGKKSIPEGMDAGTS